VAWFSRKGSHFVEPAEQKEQFGSLHNGSGAECVMDRERSGSRKKLPWAERTDAEHPIPDVMESAPLAATVRQN